MKKRPAAVVAVLVTLSIGTAATLWSRQPKKEPPVQTKEVLSEVYHVDQIYRSMKGPSSQQVVYLGDPEHPELVWVVGYDATMVTPDGETTLPQEYMCHSNLDIDPRRHAAELDSSKAISGRLFTLSQGQLEIDLPKGFGIPMMSDEPLVLTTQVLNLNHEDADLEVRHRVRVRYIRNADLKKPMKPLFPTAAYGLEVIGDEPAHFGRM